MANFARASATIVRQPSSFAAAHRPRPCRRRRRSAGGAAARTPPRTPSRRRARGSGCVLTDELVRLRRALPPARRRRGARRPPPRGHARRAASPSITVKSTARSSRSTPAGGGRRLSHSSALHEDVDLAAAGQARPPSASSSAMPYESSFGVPGLQHLTRVLVDVGLDAAAGDGAAELAALRDRELRAHRPRRRPARRDDGRDRDRLPSARQRSTSSRISFTPHASFRCR